MLQPFEWMGYFTPDWYIAKEKIFCLFNFPDAQPCGFVNLMLKKNRHEGDFRF